MTKARRNRPAAHRHRGEKRHGSRRETRAARLAANPNRSSAFKKTTQSRQQRVAAAGATVNTFAQFEETLLPNQRGWRQHTAAAYGERVISLRKQHTRLHRAITALTVPFSERIARLAEEGRKAEDIAQTVTTVLGVVVRLQEGVWHLLGNLGDQGALELAKSRCRELAHYYVYPEQR